jgi:hypothetical protein
MKKTFTEIETLLKESPLNTRVEIKPGNPTRDIAIRSFVRLPNKQEIQDRKIGSSLFLVSERILTNGIAAYFGKTEYKIVTSNWGKYWNGDETGETKEDSFDFIQIIEPEKFNEILLEYLHKNERNKE